MTVKVRRIVFYLTGIVLGLLWAVVLDAFVSAGAPRYSLYRARRLCGRIAVGMPRSTLATEISALGEPNWMEYEQGAVSVSGVDVTCYIQFDANDRVTSVRTFAPGPMDY